MANFRSADVFVKPRHDLQTKSAVGGIVTLIAGVTAALLFIAQLYWYVVGTTQHSLHLSKSRSIPMLAGHTNDPFVNRNFEMRGKIPLKLHVTFPHLSCDKLEVKLDGADLSSKDFDPKRSSSKQLEKRKPSPKELTSAVGNPNHKGGCTIRTVLRIPVVAGHVTITLSRLAWSAAAKELVLKTQMISSLGGQGGGAGAPSIGNDFNVSHYIHSIQFGTPFPLAAASPMEGRRHFVENAMGGIALVNIQAKLVPTVYKRMFFSQDTYQLSVVDHIVQPDTLVSHGVPLLPGLSLGYDITPLAVHHVEARPNIFVFLSSLVSIVGGVFVTVGLVTGCLVNTAQAAIVSKKVD
jgi:Endoplasmic reticulum vesicle transporter/Endoplasmic Reticulum-Golgi Intermediate Compartment (ERGIC)